MGHLPSIRLQFAPLLPLSSKPPSSPADRFDELHRRFKDRPLIELLRKLIIKLEHPEFGTKSHQVLQTLTGQKLACRSSLWLDWLEEQDQGELTWEHLLKALNPGPADAEKTRRLVVELTPATSDSEHPPIMTPEQALWKKALERHQKGSPSWSRKMTLASISLILVLLVYAFLRFAPPIPLEWLSSWKSNSVQPPDQLVPSLRTDFFHPAIVWGQFDPALCPGSPWSGLEPDSGLNRPHLELLDLNQHIPFMERWRNILLETRPAPEIRIGMASFFALNEYEQHFMSNNEAMSEPLFFPLKEPEGEKLWSWRRYDASGVELDHGSLSQTVRHMGKTAHFEVVRQSDGSGCASAHAFNLNSYGLQQWAWRLRISSHVLEGRAWRSPDREKLSIQYKYLAGEKSESLSLNVHAWQVILPALWCPGLARHPAGDVLLPHSAACSPHQRFFSPPYLTSPEKDRFSFQAADGSWKEIWQR